jgi:AcrR family transcriptional regulator
VLDAVRELLREGSFHESTVDQVAARAGVSRASLYQHFGSRLELVDAICETFADNEALQAAKSARTVDELVRASVDFWDSEEPLLVQLYGAAAVDPAAKAFVERQRRDRYLALERVLGGKQDLPTLAVLTSFETYLELRRHNRLSKREVTRTLQEAGRALCVSAAATGAAAETTY